MDDTFEQLLAAIRETNSFDLQIVIDDEGESITALGEDIGALQRILFLAGLAELLCARAAFATGTKEWLPYDVDVLAALPQILNGRHAGDTYRRFFHEQLRRRKGGYAAIGSSDILRIELLAVSTNSPKKFIAKLRGAAVALGAFACLGGAYEVGRYSQPPPPPAIVEQAPSVTDRVNQLWQKYDDNGGYLSPRDQELLKELMPYAYPATVAAHEEAKEDRKFDWIHVTFDLGAGASLLSMKLEKKKGEDGNR